MAMARNVALPAQLAAENSATAATVQVCGVLHVKYPLFVPLVQQWCTPSPVVCASTTPSAEHTTPEQVGKFSATTGCSRQRDVAVARTNASRQRWIDVARIARPAVTQRQQTHDVSHGKSVTVMWRAPALSQNARVVANARRSGGAWRPSATLRHSACGGKTVPHCAVTVTADM